jgi:hypothetical protein
MEGEVLLNRQKIYNIVSVHLRSCEFSRGDLLELIDSNYPGTNHDSILPSDYLCRDALKDDESNDDNRGDYWNFPRFLERLERNRYVFVGWDGMEVGSIDAPVLRVGTSEQKANARVEHTQLCPGITTSSSSAGRLDKNHDKLVNALRKLAPKIRKSSDRAWLREPALRVIDCVLSLHRPYDSFVVRRLDEFERKHPDVRTVTDLQKLIARYSSPSQFVLEVLNYNDSARAETLAAVVDWLVTITGNGSSSDQLVKLEDWVSKATPTDYKKPNIGGFALGGFQYLRMLFGANTTKPDVHIRRYVAAKVEHPVSDTKALLLLESAAIEAGLVLRDIDTTVWEGSARRTR